jgi:hypothetical protein
MKPLFLFIFLCTGIASSAQLSLTKFVLGDDTAICTNSQPLHTDTSGSTVKVTDDVIGVKMTGRKKNSYWLYFFFIPDDIPDSTVSISSKRFAYIRTAQDRYYRIPYSGKAFSYSTKTKVSFFIDITNYASRLKDEVITDVRLETSVLYHAIELKDTTQKTIARVVNTLMAY